MAESARANLNAWEGVSIKAADYREVDEKRVLVLNHFTARGKRSGMEMGQLGMNGAHLFHLDNGKVTRLVVYYDSDQALADLGLKE
jgi:ketosteroid isomerase-like protein